MTDPIKVRIMKTLETMLAEIPELGSIHRWEEIPVDLATLELPALFYWEEEDREIRNRIAWNTLSLNLAVFDRLVSYDGPGYQQFSDLADVLAAKISNKLAIPQTLRAAGLISLEEQAVRKALANEEYGELAMSFTLIYGHAVGDAFSTDFS